MVRPAFGLPSEFLCKAPHLIGGTQIVSKQLDYFANSRLISLHTASTRVGPPEAPMIFAAPTKTIAPAGGSLDGLATHSRTHLPGPSQSL